MKTNIYDPAKIFYAQINGLQNKGAPPKAWHYLGNLKDKVLATDWQKIDNSVIFLPVIPFSFWPFYNQLKTVKLHNAECVSKIRKDRILNLPGIPEMPYYLIGVHEGSEYIKYDLGIAQLDFVAHNRLGLTLEEVISLARYTGLLAKHNIAALSSYYQSPDEIIFLESAKNEPAIDSIKVKFHGHNVAAPYGLQRIS